MSFFTKRNLNVCSFQMHKRFSEKGCAGVLRSPLKHIKTFSIEEPYPITGIAVNCALSRTRRARDRVIMMDYSNILKRDRVCTKLLGLMQKNNRSYIKE